MTGHRITAAGWRGRGSRGVLPLALTAAVTAALAAAPAQAAESSAACGRGAAGSISTVAGGVGGPGLATTVDFGSLCGVSYAAGKLYVGAEAVRAVNTTTDQLTTPAGTDLRQGKLGDGSPATAARIDACGASLDHAGNLLIADRTDARVRVRGGRNRDVLRPEHDGRPHLHGRRQRPERAFR